ncbi:MAG: VanZ family protein [Candidatus Sumerlaeia bacterium]
MKTDGNLAARFLRWAERHGNAHPLWYYTLPLTLCIVAIMVASLMPSSQVPKIRVSDKLVHGAMYAGLGWLLLRAWVRGRQPTGAAVLLVGAIGAVWGLYLECLQGLTPDRSFEILDEVFNIAGTFAGMISWLGWNRVFLRICGL